MPENKHIAFFNYPAHGHLNPALPVVAELVRRGHRVTYAAPRRYAGAVADAGAAVLTYASTTPENWEDVAIPEKPTGDDAANAMLAQVLEGFAPLPAAEERLADDVPDLIVFDQYAHHTGRLLARKWSLPSVQTCTTFAANAEYSPYARLAELSDVQLDFTHPSFAELGKVFRATLDEHGFADLSVEEFSAGGEDLSVVFLPKSFQLGAETFGDGFVFTGPSLGNGRRAGDGDWTPPAGDRPLLLITMGSHGYENRAEFYRQCVRAFGDVDWAVVMAVGTQVKPAELGPLPSNFDVVPWVPQLEVLRRADALLAHAGMGSTMEALYFGVPPVVVPRLGEQQLIGERLVELGLGRMVMPSDADAETLRAAVLGLAGDSAAKERVAKVRDEIHAAGGTSAAADAIEAVAKSR
ncbi:macrolide family glycosyltransferase [Amycolatopsis plumensis]|uniref:Macrolide family glycosyltransferase n=1 Tax=Amycolatopsis plumensis TaxID=236508 RepID=A0ABV5TUK5_9PSEU